LRGAVIAPPANKTYSNRFSISHVVRDTRKAQRIFLEFGILKSRTPNAPFWLPVCRTHFPLPCLIALMDNSQQERVLRVHFLLFVKVLFRILQKSEDELLREQAKLLILCRQSSQELRQTMATELKLLVGESIWDQAEKYTLFYLKKKNELQQRALIRRSIAAIKKYDDEPFRNTTSAIDFEPTPIRTPHSLVSARKA
jgi:hypothetical protein